MWIQNQRGGGWLHTGMCVHCCGLLHSANHSFTSTHHYLLLFLPLSSFVFSFPQSPSTCLLGLSILCSLQLHVCSSSPLAQKSLLAGSSTVNTAIVVYILHCTETDVCIGMDKDVSKFSNQLLINTTVTTSLLLFIFFLFFFSSLISFSFFLLGV